MHTTEPSSIATAVVHPEGFSPSSRVPIPTPGSPDTPIPLLLASQQRTTTATSCCLSHALHADPAADHLLVLTAPLWVFNCTAVPIALRPARGGAEEGSEEGPAERHPSTSEQQHPWLLPYGGMGWAPFAAPGGARGPRGAPGLEELVEAIVTGTVGGGRGGRAARMGGVGRQRMASFRSDALLTRSLEQHVCRYVMILLTMREEHMREYIHDQYSPPTPLSHRHAAVLGSIQPGPSGRLAVEVRVGTTSARGPQGWAPWSEPCEVDPLRGPSMVAAPLEGAGSTASCYALMLVASPVPGMVGGMVLHVLPRCVMHNALDLPIQVWCVWWW